LDLAEANIGDSLHISDVKLPEGVVPTIADRDFTIATIAAPAGLDDTDDEVEEGIEGEEGDEDDSNEEGEE
ncbi:MAG: 50S ribosomal protein L25, partial [Pseudomonadota bacterium]|nr:50S ribosomal protein L25 [Pseudomonadota bacterium]